MSQYQDPYGQQPHHNQQQQPHYTDDQPQPPSQYNYSDRPLSSASINYNSQAQPRASLHHQHSQESGITNGDRSSTYAVDDEKSFARPRPLGNGAIDPDTGEPVRRSRFVGMGANGERPASQWTQGMSAWENPISSEWSALAELLWRRAVCNEQVSKHHLNPRAGLESGVKRTELDGQR